MFPKADPPSYKAKISKFLHSPWSKMSITFDGLTDGPGRVCWIPPLAGSMHKVVVVDGDRRKKITLIE